MERWIVKTTMDDTSIKRESMEMAKELDRLKAVVLDILGKYPNGITENELLAKLPQNIDKDAVQNIMPFLFIEGLVVASVGYLKAT